MKVDWGGKSEANHTSECLLSEVDWGAHDTHTSGCMLSEVDWGAYHSSFPFTLSTLTMMEIQRVLSPKTMGRTTTKKVLHPSHGVSERFF